MQNLSCRWAAAKDCERIFDVLTRAFHLLRGTVRWNHARQLVDSTYRRFRVLCLDNDIVGIAHLSVHRLQIGRSLVDLGYVGQVAIVPELQHQGLGSYLVREILERMEADGFDVARLSGLVRFYERFGWTPFPRRFVEFPLRRLRAGTAEVAVADILVAPNRGDGCVRPYQPEIDGRGRDALLKRFNRYRTGAARSPRTSRAYPLPEQMPSEWQFVYVEQKRVLGYLATHVFPEDVSDFEASVNLREVAFDLSRPDVVIGLVKHVLAAAHERGATRVTARMPWDPQLMAILREGGLVFEQVELYNAVAGNMLKLIQLPRLLDKIVPELTNRWTARSLGLDGTLQLEVDESPASLALRPQSVRVLTSSPPPPTWSVRLSQHEFFRLLLGLAPAGSVVWRSPHPLAGLVLDALFPVQKTASGTWG